MHGLKLSEKSNFDNGKLVQEKIRKYVLDTHSGTQDDQRLHSSTAYFKPCNRLSRHFRVRTQHPD